jgi:molybdopterin-guanine dinucleotide biosynthesis protein
MERLIIEDKTYKYYEYTLEGEFEKVIVDNAKQIFGFNVVYIDIKKKIGDSIVTIPDGYLIDFTFAEKPRLYIIENEISTHDPYKHIGSQLLKFAISYKASGRNIKKFILDFLIVNKDSYDFIEKRLKTSGYRNIDAFLDAIIFDVPVTAIVIIDKSSRELENVLSQLAMKTDIIEFQTFNNGNEQIHKFNPFNEEIRDIEESNKKDVSVEDLDTIVVAAQAEGFQTVFLSGNCWWSIRISSSMLERIKYIAAYQVAPISAITHIAEVAKIEKYKDTNKYIVYFKDPAKEISHVLLDTKKKGTAPQAPRYTTYKKLMKAKVLSDVF